MNNFASSLIKLTALAGGAVIGALVARWLDEVATTRAEERSERDRTRYAQGLSPIADDGRNRQGTQQ
ncbi:MAG TPA: hypothetical protein VKV20_10340 [Ktedonobacteraceae bacterium]|jgi:hypothetical protein|nr:hypothetical protein [Ktedonobacteraceae bacterium]